MPGVRAMNASIGPFEMHNQALLPCITCGYLTSRSAAKCPRCGEIEFIGYKCVFCGGRLRYKDSWTTVVPEHYGDLQFPHAHISCVERYFTPSSKVTFRCHDCQKPIATPTLAQLLRGKFNPCPNCGSQRPIGPKGNCGICVYPVYPQFQDLGGSKYNCYHKYCVKRVRAAHNQKGNRDKYASVITAVVITILLFALGMALRGKLDVTSIVSLGTWNSILPTP